MRTLCLDNTEVTDNGMEAIMHLTQLQRLDLCGTKVTDVGLKRLWNLNRLERLGCADTDVTDADLEYLIELPQLKRLSLGCTFVTDAGMVNFQKALPGCTITEAVDRFTSDWYLACMNRWDALLCKAGQNKRGLVLEARLMINRPAKPPDLMLHVRNLGVQPVRIEEGAGEQPPIVLIRDESSKSVPVTKTGEEFHAPRLFAIGSSWTITVWPGDFRESGLIPLDAHFVLSKPGTYTVLAIKSVVGIDGYVVAKPVTFTIPPTSVSDGSHSSSYVAAGDVQNHSEKQGRSSEEKWSRLAAIAGLPKYGYVLEADISPVTPDAIHLVASLIHIIGPTDINLDPSHASVATEYCVLVRDSAGRFIEVNESARNASAADKRSVRRDLLRLGPGTLSGVLIPLARWFDMISPGEYTVLVSLPTHRDTEPLWVAKPVKVKVGKHVNADLPELIDDGHVYRSRGGN